MHQLVSKDAKGKVRVVEMSAGWDNSQYGYVIHRTTYQLGGKQTPQPDIWIYKGKASRTLKEQLNLEYKSNMKKYLDNVLVCLNKFTSDTDEEIQCIKEYCDLNNVPFVISDTWSNCTVQFLITACFHNYRIQLQSYKQCSTWNH